MRSIIRNSVIMITLLLWVGVLVTGLADNDKPPIGKKWFYEEDEKVYKFSINPITPKEGITGGILIYYGHYVKPPYKVEFSMDFPDDCYVKVNNLCVFPGNKEVDKKIQDRVRFKIYGKKVLPSKKFIEQSKKEKALNNEISTYHDLLLKKYDAETQEGNYEIVKKLKIYLTNHKIVKKWFVRDAFRFGIINPYSSLEGIWTEFVLSDWDRLPDNKKREILKKRYIHTKEWWEKHLKVTVTYTGFGHKTISTKTQLCQIKTTLNSAAGREQKIKTIYEIISSYDAALFMVLNLNTNDIDCEEF